MDMKAVQAVLDTLVFAVEQAVHLQDENALILITEIFRAIFAQGRDVALQVLEHLQTLFVE